VLSIATLTRNFAKLVRNPHDAARQGAPQATQVADRFHLTKNVREKLKDLLDRKRTCLPFVERSTVQSAPAMLPASQEQVSLGEAAMREQEKSPSPVNGTVLEQWDAGDSARPLTAPQWRRKVSREKRYALYEDVRELRKQGLSHSAIADTASHQSSHRPAISGRRAVSRTSLWSQTTAAEHRCALSALPPRALAGRMSQGTPTLR
jgi:hypothetical protein